ncbi:AraC family transcriptional regulator [Denitromonas ohlonensis]|nr:helix-turn-helix domain-containing protein [Denitromonas ohlonensis]
MSRWMGLILLMALSSLQVAHFAWLHLDQEWVATLAYRMSLFAVAPSFFLFSQPLLNAKALPSIRPALFSHALPIVISPFLPEGLALPLAFIVGAGYLLWLARSLYALRQERANFHREMMLLGGVFGIAVGVSALGLAQASLPGKLFFSLYSVSIGTAFFLAQTTLGLRPRLSTEIREAVQTAYSNSTLNNVDCDTVLSALDRLMVTDRTYVDPNLSLPGLAERLGLSNHQLSELINARLGKSFSRYLRELRIEAAKIMLCDEPSASVLSVGLSVGFTSQSNFYEAFREIEGMAPGQFRKLRARSGPAQ